MSKDIRARIFSQCWAVPKPMHAQVIENWSQCGPGIRFSILTDHPDLWLPLTEGKANIDVVNSPLPDWFERAGIALGYPAGSQEYADFQQRRLTALNGWTACFMRPLLWSIYDLSAYDYWGWIDWDVLVDPVALQNHLRKEKSDILLFPPHRRRAVDSLRDIAGRAKAFAGLGSHTPTHSESNFFMWEHFKIFRKGVDLTPLFKRVMVDETAERHVPLCAMTCYALGGERFVRDGLPQSRIAAHWHYSDKAGASNAQNVTQASNGELKSDSGINFLFFIADTQVKEWSQDQVSAYAEKRAAGDSFFFRHEPRL